MTFVFDGLDPARAYELQAGAVRGGPISYTNRWTLLELGGAESFETYHSAGALTSSEVPALGPHQVAINFGRNHTSETGAAADWRNIRPGQDGTITLVCRKYTGTVPGGSSSGIVAYAPTALRLSDTTAGPLSIVSQPQSVLLDSGQSANFAVGARGFPKFYQWHRNLAPIEGATNDWLQVTNVSLQDDETRFHVTVSNQTEITVSAPAFVFVRPPNRLFLPYAYAWRYDATGRDLGSAWKEPGYDDTGWPSGPGALGFESEPLAEPIRTFIPASEDITFFFRTSFLYTNNPNDVDLIFTNLIDDGAVFYLNGSEIMRVRMPEGPILHFTTAAETVIDAVPEWFTIPSTQLRYGPNVMAVEVHQPNSISTDMVLGVQGWSRMLLPTPVTIVTGPTGQAVNEGEPFEFTVTVDGVGARFQWYHDLEPLDGDITLAYVKPAALLADAGSYQVVVWNAFGAVTSAPVRLEVLGDTVPPSVLGAYRTNGSTEVRLDFSEPVNPADATNPAHYTVTNTVGDSLEVQTVTMTGPSSVLLVTEAPEDQVNYLVAPRDIRDLSLSAHPVEPGIRVPVVTWFVPVPFDSVWDYYDPYPGFEDPDPGAGWQLDGFEATGWTPGQAAFVLDFESQSIAVPRRTSLLWDVLTTYFRRTFDISGSSAGAQLLLRYVVDDGLAVHLNGDEVFRTNLPDGPVSHLTQASNSVGPGLILGPVELAPHRLRPGGNLLAVEVHGTTTNDLDRVMACELVHGVRSFLTGPVIILASPTNSVVGENQPATFALDVLGASHCQWMRDGAPILGATQFVYTIPMTPLAWNGSMISAVASRGTNSATSAGARLDVLPDLIPPSVVSAALRTDYQGVVITFSEAMSESSSADVSQYALTTRSGAPIPILNAWITNHSQVVLWTGPLPVVELLVTVRHLQDASVAGHAVAAGTRVSVGFRRFLIPMNGIWRYQDDFFDPDTAQVDWKSPALDDTGWKSGPGVFAYPPEELLPLGRTVGTVLVLYPEGQTQGFSTYTCYFRALLPLPYGLETDVIVSNLVDDGAVFYLNGQEIQRIFMPPGPVSHTNLAELPPDVLFQGHQNFVIPANLFIAGTNLLAVEVHQGRTNSTDLVFGCELFLANDSVVLPPITGLEIHIRRLDSSLELSWEDSEARLEEAQVLSSAPEAWSPVSNPANPYTVEFQGGARFYRLKK